MTFRISGLPLEAFTHLFDLGDEALASRGAQRYVADVTPGFPCRVTLEDAAPGETVLLLNHVHQPAATPYRASHAIFVRERAARTAILIDEIPASLRARLLSVRAFDSAGMMLDADVVDGPHLETLIDRFFARDAVQQLHVHYAKRGCYAACVERIAN